MAQNNLPVGFDSADGVTPLPPQPSGSTGPYAQLGTPAPDGDVQVISNDNGNPTIENDPNFPIIERAEQATSQNKLKMSWSACLYYIALYGRGTFVTDSFLKVWRVLSSSIQRVRSGEQVGEFSLTLESISFDSPPDEYQDIPVELGINIINHPRYFWALFPTKDDYNTTVTIEGGSGPTTTNVANIKQTLIRQIQTYQDAPYFPPTNSSVLNYEGLLQNQIVSAITNSTIQVTVDGTSYTYTNTAEASAEIGAAFYAAGEIIQKLWYQLDTPYLAGRQVTWTQYYFAPVYLNPGGYLEDPVGIVPDYFFSPTQNPYTTVYDQFAQRNPQAYSNDGTTSGAVNISWLRKADEVEYQRTWFRITRTWIGSPIGHWDAQLFSNLDRPNLSNYNKYPTVPQAYLPLVNQVFT